jgi:hypothetical protein
MLHKTIADLAAGSYDPKGYMFYKTKNADYKPIWQVEGEGVEERKHSHYFKKVGDLTEIDVYNVLYLFNVNDPCLSHAVKKLLCAGQRGVKDKNKDVQEAIDTLNRYLEINHG